MRNTFVLFALVSGALSASIPPSSNEAVARANIAVPLANSVVNSASYEVFQNTPTLTLDTSLSTRDDEPDPNRNTTTPDYIFTLFCTDAGFHGDCLVFGAPPGKCASFFSFQSGNSTAVSDVFNDAVSSLSVNTGGNCQFYKYKGCDDKGDDRGLTSSYNYNLAVALPDDPRTVEYENQITSWRC